MTEIKMLSDWYPGLEGTAGDTEVYVLEGEQEGDSDAGAGGHPPMSLPAWWPPSCSLRTPSLRRAPVRHPADQQQRLHLH